AAPRPGSPEKRITHVLGQQSERLVALRGPHARGRRGLSQPLVVRQCALGQEAVAAQAALGPAERFVATTGSVQFGRDAQVVPAMIIELSSIDGDDGVDVTLGPR